MNSLYMHLLRHNQHGGNTMNNSSVNVINIPCKVSRPKVISHFEDEESYPDVDEGFFLYEVFGKAMFRPRNWDSQPRDGLLQYDTVKHQKVLDTLSVDSKVNISI